MPRRRQRLYVPPTPPGCGDHLFGGLSSQFGHHLSQTTGNTNLCDHLEAESLALRGQIASKQAESARGRLMCLCPPRLSLWMDSVDRGTLHQALANVSSPTVQHHFTLG